MPPFETNQQDDSAHPVAPPPQDNPQTRPPENSGAVGAPSQPKKSRKRTFIVLGILLLVGAIYGIRIVLFHASHVQTDDAQIEGHISPVIPQVSGYVTQVLVDDNQRVEANEVLVRIDPREVQARLRLAEAALQTGSAALREMKASADAAMARREKAVSDL